MPNGREKISPAITPISSCAMLIKTLTTQNNFIQQLWKKSDVNFAIRFVTFAKQSIFSQVFISGSFDKCQIYDDNFKQLF